MTRAALAAALFGLALALTLPALHLSAAPTGVLVDRWWPAVLLVAGVGGLLSRRRFYGPTVPAIIALLGAALVAGRIAGLPLAPLLLAAILLAVGLRLVVGGGPGGGLVRRALLRGVPFGPRTLRLAGEVHLGGPDFRVENSSTYLWVGELHLDLTSTRLPEGTTPLQVGMFAGEVVVTLPPDVGVRASSSMFAGEINILGHNSQGVSPHLSVESEDYAQRPRRVDIDVRMWFGELDIRRRG